MMIVVRMMMMMVMTIVVMIIDHDFDDHDDEDIGGNDCDKVDIVCKVVGRLVNVFANHFACAV